MFPYGGVQERLERCAVRVLKDFIPLCSSSYDLGKLINLSKHLFFLL